MLQDVHYDRKIPIAMALEMDWNAACTCCVQLLDTSSTVSSPSVHLHIEHHNG